MCLGGSFTVDHSLICKIEGFVTKRHNELRDLEAELLTVRYSVILRLSQSSKTSLENSYEEDLRSNKPQDARLDIHTLGVAGAPTISIL